MTGGFSPQITIKLAIAKKESYETHYWLRVIRDTHLLPVEESTHFRPLQRRMKSIIQESLEVKKILTSAVKTAQENP
ncbi:four helix bundle protein [bacterium]|nr:four helix bundle protein [bacterium]